MSRILKYWIDPFTYAHAERKLEQPGGARCRSPRSGAGCLPVYERKNFSPSIWSQGRGTAPKPL